MLEPCHPQTPSKGFEDSRRVCRRQAGRSHRCHWRCLCSPQIQPLGRHQRAFRRGPNLRCGMSDCPSLRAVTALPTPPRCRAASPCNRWSQTQSLSRHQPFELPPACTRSRLHSKKSVLTKSRSALSNHRQRFASISIDSFCKSMKKPARSVMRAHPGGLNRR